MQKIGGYLIGVGGLLIASTYQDWSDVEADEELDDLEKKYDNQRLRGQIGGGMIAFGGFLLSM